MWLTLTVNGKKIAIGTAYRPPWLDLVLFLDAVTDYLSSLGHCDNYILLGDFNVNMLDTSGIKTRKINEFLHSLSLTQLVSTPTHFTATSETLIDLLCTDLVARSTSVESFGSFNGHSVIVSEFNVKRDKFKPYVVKIRPLRDVCLKSFNKDLELLCMCLKIMSKLENINDMVDFFNHHITALFDVHAPIKTCTIRERSSPWITDTIRLMMRLRDKALTTY
ncbi:hypothetical protein PYW08_014773 [Mythimna loreyi]|uniref:Uncharacterized protein n=1 Tax=Mythimna loreyi TaxID=667449 RepID=A0ACC2R2T7_9NEOP|nr:hypothetical protein PYW08_014773 [Mythimna loreyi]